MSREPDWDSKSAKELAILTAISGRACATYLHQIKVLLGAMLGLLGVVSARYLGWM